jgi:hypothetical protein
MKDVQAERILNLFKECGLEITPGATFSVRGQIAQLLNGCERLIDQCAVAAGRKVESQNIPDGQAVADVVREI